MLKESFGTPDDVERYKVSSTIFNARMHDGTSITDHVLYMIEMIEHLDKLGFPFNWTGCRGPPKNNIYIQLDLIADAASPGRSQETCGFQSVVYSNWGVFLDF